MWKTGKVVENFFKDLILEKKELFQTDVEAQLFFSLKFGVKETYLAQKRGITLHSCFFLKKRVLLFLCAKRLKKNECSHLFKVAVSLLGFSARNLLFSRLCLNFRASAATIRVCKCMHYTCVPIAAVTISILFMQCMCYVGHTHTPSVLQRTKIACFVFNGKA